MSFEKDARVYVKDVGFGRVAYVRLAPPDFTTPAAVSVVLDSEKNRPRYLGSIFPAELVSLAEEE